MRLLALDIGNTNVTAGLFAEGADSLAADFRLRTDADRTADNYAADIDALLNLRTGGKCRLADIGAVAIASVVPRVTQTLREMTERYLGTSPFVVRAGETDTGMTVRYAPPESLGADRLVNAFAAHALFGQAGDGPSACIVVDYGTATKLEAVSASGEYVGGAILPGVGLSMDALFQRAALLRQIDLSVPPPSAIGGNTADALRSGILLGSGAQIDGLVGRFREQLAAPDAKVVATGGWSARFAPYAATIGVIEPNLTLIGLRLLYARAATRSG